MIGFRLAILLLALPAWPAVAQTSNATALGDDAADPPPLVAPPPVDASRATSLKAGVIPAPNGPAPPKAVAPDVTVTGRRLKPCSNHDGACIASISAEIWRRYPKEIQAMCDRQRIHAMREGFNEEDLGITGVANDHLTPQTEALCDFGAKMRKKAKAGAADGAPAPGP